VEQAKATPKFWEKRCSEQRDFLLGRTHWCDLGAKKQYVTRVYASLEKERSEQVKRAQTGQSFKGETQNGLHSKPMIEPYPAP
jgi:hypothetical protein